MNTPRVYIFNLIIIKNIIMATNGLAYMRAIPCE